MGDWNVLVTFAPGARNRRRLCDALEPRCRFRATPYRGVLIGRIDDAPAFLEGLRTARERHEPWAELVARAIPLEQTFDFSPETLAAQLQEAVTRFADALCGSFHVRLERRGLAGRVATRAIERAVADHLYTLAAQRGVALRTDFADPDYLVAAETVGNACGVALIRRETRLRYPFVAPR
ncbi:MAG: hypothetical protein EPO27_17860 [Betaproteobacteria bacterium]|nr:MAG: hypothetical protein EPO27_17860 [Betaproteobacteria bacterium]